MWSVKRNTIQTGTYITHFLMKQYTADKMSNFTPFLLYLRSHVVYAAPAKLCHMRQERNVSWWLGKAQSVNSDQATLRWNVQQIAAWFPAGQKIYLISRLGPNRPVKCVLETLPRSKETRGGADQSPTSSVLVKNERSYTSTLPHTFMPCYGTPVPVYGTGLAIIWSIFY
jgi:hypothetical protein